MTRMPTGLRALTVALLVFAGAATALGFLGAWWWPFDVLANFRLQYAVGTAAVALLALALRQKVAGLAALGLVAVNAALVVPPCFGSPAAGAPALTVISANVNSANTDYATLLGEVRRRRPDVLVVLEVSEGWARALAEGLPDYTSRTIVARGDNFGIALLARVPLSAEVIAFTADAPPSIVAHIPRDGRDLVLVATHPMPPVGASAAARRDAQLAAVADLARRSGPLVVVVGDLNATPWSSAFRDLEDAGLADTRAGFGLQATWPAGFAPMAIPIDHCLVGAGLGASGREVLDDIGSDHYPIAVALVAR
ncbi:MAG: endonuclease/exonuclease/phosphatase family protein [Myxococcota bacterium]